ncbi:MAG TPA: protein kinase, partial [Pirellulales bacterium]|nr:protein kinase [Pirellulales bacterium]
MSLSIARFIEGLSQIGLLAPAEIESLKTAQADKLEADADALARELVEQGKLTRFQAAALYQGRAEALVLGNYLVIDKLGAGGMGQVFRARHRRMDRVVALKVLSKKQLGSPEAVARFQREVKAAARLTHPHIVTAHDADEAAGMHYLVMEYVEGQDLSAVVKAHGPISVPQAVDYMIQAARGLEHAHSQGVIHRDVKPSNLLLDKKGTVKILDMGLARVDNPLAGPDSGEGLTAAGSVMGTIDFMSPEQALDTAQADARSDIYSLGCTLYFLLTGKKPYDGDTAMKKILAHREQPVPSLAKERPEVPADLEAVYRKLVAKRPDQRYATMREVREALEAVQAGRRPLGIGTAASPVPVAPRMGMQMQTPSTSPAMAGGGATRSKMPLIAAAASILLVLVGGLVVSKMIASGPAEEAVLADAGSKQDATRDIEPTAQAALKPATQAASPAIAPGEGSQPSPENAVSPAAPSTASPSDTSPSDTGALGSEPIAPSLMPPEPMNSPTPGSLAADSLPPGRAPSALPPTNSVSGPMAPAVVAADPDSSAEKPPQTVDVPLTPADPALERRTAEWALATKAKIAIMVGGQTMHPVQAAQLPQQPFTLTSADF